ncbi:4-hydroxy-tetrahydrodipicolinate synthase [Desulfohalovibrio reitneri]|uniref:4-hydroxy-tetrahydrodipicolinate synthase n=1 Tax=Desulfohalovibrio reitneri TaxID=1307759 RepID=UPI0004A740E7|nr:4-hydroxy-tetrahydrodipicolinate synthase [Desulfohalovibrio reitneri]
MQFKGAFTALVTPFRDGEVDETAYRDLIEWQIEQGIHGLVPCGTTGESATLSHEEHKRVISICVDQTKKRVPVLAGAGSNNTREAVELTRYAKEAGADGALLITPYYNKPTQRGLVAHFKTIAQEVDLPFIVYNVPGRTGVNCLPETQAELFSTIQQVKGVKEATADLVQVSRIIELCGPEFAFLSGDDFTVLPSLSVGGHGVISVVTNIAPSLMASMCEAYAAGETNRAKDLHYQLAPLCRAMFAETNPIPAKTALGMMGKIKTELRLPLYPMEEKNEALVRDALELAGLL